MEKEFGEKISFVHVDIDQTESRDAVKKWKVRAIPRVVLVDEKGENTCLHQEW